MSTTFSPSALLRLFTLGSASVLVNLLGTTVVWGQSVASSALTTQTPLVSKQEQNLSGLQLHQLKEASTNAADLFSTCNQELSKISDTDFKSDLNSDCLAQTDSQTEGEDEESNILQPTKDRLRIELQKGDTEGFTFGFGSLVGEPTALQGGTRKRINTIGQRVSLFPAGGHFQQGLGANQRLLLEVIGDAQAVGFDLSYTIAPKTIPGAFSVNAQTQRSFVGVFQEGDKDVSLSGGADPWVHRSGGGVEYYIPFSDQFSLATGLNYQLVSVRTGAFTNQVKSRDEEGNRVTVDDDGLDTLLTFNLATLFATVDDAAYPTKGSRLRGSIDASIPIGDASIAYGRFAGSFSQYVPLNLFGFSEGPKTLIFGLLAGTMTGDVPPYEAFSMGGSRSVRGYSGGELGTGSSFFIASTEYRFPVANDLHILVDFDIQGALFFDYGTDLDTADEVIGNPGDARDKSGDGFGYGLGVHFKTDFGMLRVELALNDEGDFTSHFTVGDRY